MRKSKPGEPKGPCCSFCKMYLPAELGEEVQHLLDDLMLDSNSHPDPTNPKLRIHTNKYALSLCFEFCVRHAAISLSIADSAGQQWPTGDKIQHEHLDVRVHSLQPQLSEIVRCPTKSPLFNNLIALFAKVGARKARSTGGLFACMTSEHAGYYGEKGSLIISRTLLDLFPYGCPNNKSITSSSNIVDAPVYINSKLIQPLEYHEFRMAVLIPEAAILLIEADHDCSKAEARDHWQCSFRFGHLNNPDNNMDQLYVNGSGGIASTKSEPQDVDLLVASPNLATEEGLDSSGNPIKIIIIDD
ncbi:hypothetical protein K439DRAFT_1338784 [Ramaria rubella]|nr:hypothetical protein K439DRAFT_1338784 [Ramaria rubella]